MNVLILTTHLNFGGIASYVVNLAKELKRSGHHVFVGSSGGDWVAHIADEGVTHINLDIKTKSELSPKIIASFLKLKKIIKEEDIQIIHAQTRVTQVLGYLLGKFLAVPFVSTCHGYFRPHLGRRIFGCWGDKVIAISSAVKTHLIKDFKVRPESVELVYSGVEIKPKQEFDKQIIRKKLGLKDGPVVGIIARLSPVKGHKYLIGAMKEVIAVEPEAQLLIVGDGPLKAELLNLIDIAGIRNNTVLIPSTGNLSEVFSVMSVYAAPSVKEGLGLSILEAQANCLPCAAFRTGGISDIIDDGATGLLAEPLDIKSLASSIVRLLRDEELSLRIARQAYKTVADKFSLKLMAENTVKVYEKALLSLGRGLK